MSKKILLDAFYTQFSEFLSELSRVFPDDPDFPAYNAQLLLVKRVNPVIAVREFTTHVVPIEDIIRARDANYFLAGKPSKTLVDAITTDNIEPVVQKLKSYWRQMSAENQSVVWSYMLLLVEIAKRYSVVEGVRG